MKTAHKVVDKLLEMDIRSLIRAGMPRQNTKHTIAEVFKEMGWTVLNINDKGFKDSVVVEFTTNDKRLQGGETHVRAEIRDKLDARLSVVLRPGYKGVTFPTGNFPKEFYWEWEKPKPASYTIGIEIEGHGIHPE